jgi:hypothetical protein
MIIDVDVVRRGPIDAMAYVTYDYGHLHTVRVPFSRAAGYWRPYTTVRSDPDALEEILERLREMDIGN